MDETLRLIGTGSCRTESPGGAAFELCYDGILVLRNEEPIGVPSLRSEKIGTSVPAEDGIHAGLPA